MDKEDMINAQYRGRVLAEKGQDPGDVVGPDSGGTGIVMIAIGLLYLYHYLKS